MRNEDGTVRRDDRGNILVRDSEGNIVTVRPAAKDDHGSILVDDRGRLVTGEVLRNEDGTVRRDDRGNILVRDMEGNTVAARPAAKDDHGSILVDDRGRLVTGEVLRNEDGTVRRDDRGNLLVKDMEGNIVAARPAAEEDRGAQTSKQMPLIIGPVLDGEGNIIHDREGNPIMGRVAFDREGNIVTDPGGNPVILGSALDEEGKALRDADDEVIPLTIARNADNEVIRDEDGNPLLIPALLDKNGRILRDRDGNPIAPRVITGAGNKAVFDKDGNLILDQDANEVLTRGKDADNIGGSGPEENFSGRAGENMKYTSKTPSERGSAESDKNVFGSGMVVADKLSKEKKEDPLGGLSIVSITLDPIPFVSMKDGQKFFTGGKLPGGYVITTISTDKIVLEKNGKTKFFEMRRE